MLASQLGRESQIEELAKVGAPLVDKSYALEWSMQHDLGG